MGAEKLAVVSAGDVSLDADVVDGASEDVAALDVVS